MPKDKWPVYDWPKQLNNLNIHLAGIKGTGMCALAEVLMAAGARVSGSDVAEQFYTDQILDELGISAEPFCAEALGSAEVLVHSAAYDQSNPVVAAAYAKKLPVFTYPQVLGALSRQFDSSAVAGVHGKTTTTALTGALLKALGSPATVMAGSAVSGFGNRSTWCGGKQFLVAETCEYRRHFLYFSPRRILLTSIESDHQDYYPDQASIRQAFDEFLSTLPPGGELVYCADDPGAQSAARALKASRTDVQLTPYGENADGPWKVRFSPPAPGANRFSLEGADKEFSLQIPGRHIALDAAGAMALARSVAGTVPDNRFYDTAAGALAAFQGSRRRSEITGRTNNILFMDDYAHHPTAIDLTLKGLKEFHPDRRLVVNFQSHTYSRSAALLNEFSRCFSSADILLLQPIYASAREKNEHTGGTFTNEIFTKAIEARRRPGSTLVCSTLDEAAEKLKAILVPGDLFITLGAGNNRPLGIRLYREYSRRYGGEHIQ